MSTRTAVRSAALLLLAWRAAAAAPCPPDPTTPCSPDDADCDGVDDHRDRCPYHCDDDCAIEPAECLGDEGCSAGARCTEADRCARPDPTCASAERYVSDAACVPAAELDGLPDRCEPQPGRDVDTTFCRHYTRSVGFLGLFATPYGMAYAQRTGDPDVAAGFELFVVGRLGRFRYQRGVTIPPRWSYYLAAFGGSGAAEDFHAGGRVGLRRRFLDAGWITRVGGSLQYLLGGGQDDGARSQLPGLLVDVEVFGSLVVGLFGQLDASHGADPGAGVHLRLDLDALRELGLPL